MSLNTTPDVVVAGGGIAALEFVLALRQLAGDRAGITLIAPEADLVLRPLSIAEPLGAAEGQRRTLPEIAEDAGFRFVRAGVTAVDPQRGCVVLRAGGTVRYDSLVLAPGARRLPAFDDVIHLGDEDGTRALAALRADIGAGEVGSVAFVAPTLTGWLLPLYEAALLTARLGENVRVSLITAEEQPLAMFGVDASAQVARALDGAGVAWVGGRQPGVTGAAVTVGDATIPADRIVSLPLMRGPRIDGVPATGPYGLIPVDEFGRVRGLPAAYAIGDATDFPVKQGGIACQQAEVAAAHVAARLGADVVPVPFAPVMRASLLTGDGPPLALGPDVAGKLPGRHLARYLTPAAV
jgi:sulfide:quinone oxidoreductase